jgi:hypothetical protein
MTPRTVPKAADDQAGRDPATGALSRLGRLLSRPVFWIVLGLTLTAPAFDQGSHSPYHGLDWLLYAGLLAGILASARGWTGLSARPAGAFLARLVWALRYCSRRAGRLRPCPSRGLGAAMHPFTLPISDQRIRP